ncbi:hypothetical protein Hanom_Chr15g01342471 [Helianthus anomalus]
MIHVLSICYRAIHMFLRNTTSDWMGGLYQESDSKLLDEIMYVFTNFLGLFLINKMSNSLHYHKFLQKRNMFFKPPFVYIVLHTRGVISQVQVSHHKLNRHLYLLSGPRRGQLPVSATITHTKLRSIARNIEMARWVSRVG